MEFEIYQLRDIEKYGFMSYNFAQKHGFSMDDYDVVAKDEISHVDDTSLEQIFTDYNVGEKRRNNPNMRSLSVSDVIKFVNGDTYYVDSFGFTKIA